MTIRIALIASATLVASLVSSAARADLQGRDLDGYISTVEAYYDTDLNITWLADTSIYGYGSMSMYWADANTWAANLSIVDNINHVTYDNWRLPATLQPDASCSAQSSGGASFGFGCTGSEMGHLFYSELGGAAGQSILTSTDPDLAKFGNLREGLYWSGSENEDTPVYADAWTFSFYDGHQAANGQIYAFYALAVSPGDVAAVPEAQTYALMLAGLGLIGWRARRHG